MRYSRFAVALGALASVHCGSSATPAPVTSNGGSTGAAGSSAAVSGASSSAGQSQGGAAGAAATAGAPNGGAGAAASDDCSGRTICEGFESMALGSEPAAPYTIHKNNGTVTVDATHVHSGKQALKVSITATTVDSPSRQAMLAITGAPLIPLANNSLYGRFMIYTDRIPDSTVHWTIAHGDGPYDAKTSATYNYGGMGGLMANYYRNTTPDATDCWQSNKQVFPTGKWTCVAFHFDGQNNKMQFAIDGKDITDVDVDGNSKTDATCTKKGVDGKWYAPAPFKNITVGWESYQHDVAGAHDAWIDDLILDESVIACPAP
jgi:hypothetical protein